MSYRIEYSVRVLKEDAKSGAETLISYRNAVTVTEDGKLPLPLLQKAGQLIGLRIVESIILHRDDIVGMPDAERERYRQELPQRIHPQVEG